MQCHAILAVPAPHLTASEFLIARLTKCRAGWLRLLLCGSWQRNIRAIILKIMETKRLQRGATFDNFREP
jgi:hypothetical protein